MTDRTTTPKPLGSLVRLLNGQLVFGPVENLKPPHGHHNQQFVGPDPIADPELPVNSKLDDELRKFEFKRRFEKIQFQVREEFKSEAAKLALELWRSKPLADALNQPGPCDGDLHTKIMPWRHP